MEYRYKIVCYITDQQEKQSFAKNFEANQILVAPAELEVYFDDEEFAFVGEENKVSFIKENFEAAFNGMKKVFAEAAKDGVLSRIRE